MHTFNEFVHIAEKTTKKKIEITMAFDKTKENQFLFDVFVLKPTNRSIGDLTTKKVM